MTWDYQNKVNSLALSDIATFATIEDETPSAFSDTGMSIPGRPGVEFDPLADPSPLVVTLRVHLRWTNKDGGVTHTDGAAGHIYENLSKLKAELAKPAPIFYRTVPHAGAVRAVFKSNTPGLVGQQRHVYQFPLTIPSGSWQAATESSNSGAPATGVTTLGDRTIWDPRVSLAAAGTFTIVANGITYSIVAAAGPTYPIVIDVGAGTATATGGANALGAITFSHEHWFRLQPGHTHVVTGGSSATWYWRSRWG